MTDNERTTYQVLKGRPDFDALTKMVEEIGIDFIKTLVHPFEAEDKFYRVFGWTWDEYVIAALREDYPDIYKL